MCVCCRTITKASSSNRAWSSMAGGEPILSDILNHEWAMVKGLSGAEVDRKTIGTFGRRRGTAKLIKM